jgi:hypothetical protein
MRKIDENKVLSNIDTMINTLEYDSMRSGGKVKINAEDLLNLIALKKHYETKKKQPIAAKKVANKKEA